MISINFYNNDKRNFWKVIRHYVESNNNSGSIPPIINSDDNAQNRFGILDSEKAEILNKYFISVSTVNDSNTQLPNFGKKNVNIYYLRSIVLQTK